MRDLKKYSQCYENLEFEAEMVKYRRQAVLDFLDRHSPNHILEIGCGMDPIFLHLSAQKHVTLIEPTLSFFENAQFKSQSFQNVNVEQTSLEDAHLEARFDAIIVSCLLHEIEDQKRFLNKLNSLCVNNTIVHINVPNAQSIHRQLAVSMGLISNPYQISETQKRMQQSNPPFDDNKLKQLLIAHGFEICDSGGYFIKPFTHTQMAHLLKTGIVNDKVLDGLFELGKKIPELASEIWLDCKKSLC